VDVDAWTSLLARRALDTAAQLAAGPPVPDDEIDRWACLSAALLDPWVVLSLPEVARPSDRLTLETMAGVLAEPAATVCRNAATELFDAA
jgi:hypothetical protein